MTSYIFSYFSHATAENGSYMTVDDFLDFVLHEQSMEGATVEYCQSIIQKYEPSEYGKNNLLLSLDGEYSIHLYL